MDKETDPSRRGRPPLPRDEVRCKRVVTFVTDRELAKLKTLSGRQKDTLSSVCHRIIARHLRHVSLE